MAVLETNLFLNGFHDQHRDMRLDIDNMSYEVSLLAVLSLLIKLSKAPAFRLLKVIKIIAGAISTGGEDGHSEHCSKRGSSP